MFSFDSLGLGAELLRAVSDTGYKTPTSVQHQAIPSILAQRDLLAGAQTGTGKTAGFTLPLLQLLNASPRTSNGNDHAQGHRLQGHRPHDHNPHGYRSHGRRSLDRDPHGRRSPRPRPVRALILTPTRELASQVEESVKTYGMYLPHIKSTSIFGGVGIGPQITVLQKGVDIVVATPGRLQDHIERKTIDLSRVEILVLDEADRMLDMGFIKNIREILGFLPRKRQNLLFSATFSDEIRKLSGEFLNSPKRIQVEERNAAPELVAQMIHPVDRSRKHELLSHLIKTGGWEQVLVFTRTKHGADRLARQLKKDGISSLAIHGNKSQWARTKALKDFKRETVRVLVATDIAARGLDIDQLPHVVNYELPHVPEDYLHRIGRTGRAGNAGTAVSLVCVDEHELLRGIQRLLRRDLPSEITPGYEPDPRVRPVAIRNGRNGVGRNSSRRVTNGQNPSGHSAKGRNSSGRAATSRNSSGRNANSRAADDAGKNSSGKKNRKRPAISMGRPPRKSKPLSRRRRARPGRRAQSA